MGFLTIKRREARKNIVPPVLRSIENNYSGITKRFFGFATAMVQRPAQMIRRFVQRVINMSSNSNSVIGIALVRKAWSIHENAIRTSLLRFGEAFRIEKCIDAKRQKCFKSWSRNTESCNFVTTNLQFKVTGNLEYSLYKCAEIASFKKRGRKRWVFTCLRNKVETYRFRQ